MTYTNYPAYQPTNDGAKFRGGERWSLEVLCVPYNHREQLRERSVREGLPKLREMLLNGAVSSANGMRASWTCWYWVPPGEISWSEDQK